MIIQSSQVTRMQSKALETSQTPPKHKREASSSLEINTPQNKRHLEVDYQLILRSNSIPRDARFLIKKAAKALDTLSVRTAQQSQQLAAQSVRLKQLEQKKQKKTAVDSNETFADIVKIKRAQEEVARQSAAWSHNNGLRQARLLSNQLLERKMEDFMFNWQINSVDNE